ncbi:hypothetical protein SCLCIDRAFT_8902 [Scleroderma citrinum Foug A]|uniref:Uncharacterized protein n=1 Tax=Scleroderma citrinum Foug A TaxID=1036808 RepID=A0A0C3DR51_9AGAM|nr:hypothetical protein SCLCIDRAFT_8902 [Scleroderma citrinum Foug A]
MCSRDSCEVSQLAHRKERARAGTVPTSFPTSPSLVLFPGRLSSRLHTNGQNTKNVSSGYESFLSEPLDGPETEEEEKDVELQMTEQPEPEGRHEAVEGKDNSKIFKFQRQQPAQTWSPRLVHRVTCLAIRLAVGFDIVTVACGSAVRSRTQSLIQSLGAASRSSTELVQSIHSRTNSMARLEEDPGHVSDSRSQSGRSASASEGAQRSDGSWPDISTAAQSFVTAPATLAGTSDRRVSLETKKKRLLSTVISIQGQSKRSLGMWFTEFHYPFGSGKCKSRNPEALSRRIVTQDAKKDSSK